MARTLQKTKRIHMNRVIKKNLIDDGAKLLKNGLLGYLKKKKNRMCAKIAKGVVFITKKLIDKLLKKLKKKVKDFLKRAKKKMIQRGLTAFDILKLGADLVAGMAVIAHSMITEKKSFNEAAAEWVKAYVPQHVHDDTILEVFDFLADVNSIPKSVTKENYETNKKVWGNHKEYYMKDGYIEYQEKMTDMKYGRQHPSMDDSKDVSHNGGSEPISLIGVKR